MKCVEAKYEQKLEAMMEQVKDGYDKIEGELQIRIS